MSYDYVYKFIIVGSVGVGKTSLIQTITNADYDVHTYAPTIGIEFCSHIVDVEDKKIKCRIWDTAGQETFNSLISIYFRDVTAAILVFDGNNPESLYDIEHSWIPQIKKHNLSYMPKMILVENKCDLKRNISEEKLQHIIEKFDLLYIKSSALQKKNTHKILHDIAEYIHKNTDYTSIYELNNKHISKGYKDYDIKTKMKPRRDRYYSCDRDDNYGCCVIV